MIAQSYLIMVGQRGDPGRVFCIYGDQAVVDLDAALGMAVVWSFFCAPRNGAIHVFYVVGFPPCFYDPHGDGRVFDVFLVEVEHRVLAC